MSLQKTEDEIAGVLKGEEREKLLRDYARFHPQREAGMTPTEVCRIVQQEGANKLSAMRVLIALFDLTPRDARLAFEEAENPFRTPELLERYLKAEMAVCNCVPEARVLLREMMHVINDRSEAAYRHDNALFSQKTRELEARLGLNANAEIGCWLIFLLESKGLIWHGFNIADCWTNPKGIQFLAALDALEDGKTTGGEE